MEYSGCVSSDDDVGAQTELRLFSGGEAMPTSHWLRILPPQAS